MFTQSIYAQQYRLREFLTDRSGRLLNKSKKTEVWGSEYLNDDWYNGNVRMNGNKLYGIEKMRYNILQNLVEYQFEGLTYGLADEITEFDIEDRNGDNNSKRIFRKGFRNDENPSEKLFYEILYDGKTKLVRKWAINIVTYTEPMTTNQTRRYLQVFSLYISKNNQLFKIKKDKKHVLKVLEDKHDELSKYISASNIALNTEENIIEVLRFYDGL